MVYIRKHSAFFVLTVLAAYFYIAHSNIQNKHTHFYPNGVVVTHSHPVDHDDNEPLNHHDHSKTEICFYSTFHFDFYDITEPLSCDVDLSESPVVFYIPDSQVFTTDFHVKTDPRGPPVFDVLA